MLLRLRIALLAACVLVLSPVVQGKILGVFQGTIIKASKQYLYVQGKSGFVRKVNVMHAVVEYDEQFPARSRRSRPSDGLKVAALVRITAEQKNQSWHASEVLILAPERESRGDEPTAASGELTAAKIK
jgi:hypothetical protein